MPNQREDVGHLVPSVISFTTSRDLEVNIMREVGSSGTYFWARPVGHTRAQGKFTDERSLIQIMVHGAPNPLLLGAIEPIIWKETSRP